MDFLGIGAGEIVLILVLAFIVLGPGKFQDIVKTLGKTIRYFKKVSTDLTVNINRELDTFKNDLSVSNETDEKPSSNIKEKITSDESTNISAQERSRQ